MRKPEFFMVGAPRCGTTALHSYLADHPQIFMNEVWKEVNYFGSDLHYYKQIRPACREEYMRLFAGAPSGARIGERSPSYFFSTHAASEIREFNPSARIIIMLRNPVDMMYSMQRLLLHLGIETLTDFGAALNAEEDRKLGRRLPDRPHMRGLLMYQRVARLTQHVSRYLDVFGREKVHIIIFDDFIKDTASVYRETLRFLEVDPEYLTVFRRENANPVARNQILHSFTLRPPAAIKTIIQALLGEKLVRRSAETVMSWNTAHRQRPPLDPELAARLRTEFRPEVERLSGMLGRDLTSWCNPPN